MSTKTKPHFFKNQCLWLTVIIKYKYSEYSPTQGKKDFYPILDEEACLFPYIVQN